MPASMTGVAIVLAALVAGSQDTPPRVAELIQALGSDRIEEREAAAKELRNIGKPALPALKRVAEDSEPELTARALALIEQIAADENPLLNPQSPASNRRAPAEFKVRFSTSRGEFVVQVTRDSAPLAADRFYNLVRNGFYTECRFYRVIPGFACQFGIHADPKVSAAWKDARIEDDPLKKGNKRGRITFARAGPHTSTTQLYINLKDNDYLDGLGFASFGEVTAGMEVVESLYSGYGECRPMGTGPEQGRALSEGNRYLEEFKKLDFIREAKIILD